MTRKKRHPLFCLPPHTMPLSTASWRKAASKPLLTFSEQGKKPRKRKAECLGLPDRATVEAFTETHPMPACRVLEGEAQPLGDCAPPLTSAPPPEACGGWTSVADARDHVVNKQRSLWIAGGAGTGESTLAQELVEELREQGHTVTSWR